MISNNQRLVNLNEGVMLMQLQEKIRQSNRLVESPYAQEFTAYEIKIFEIAASYVTLDDLRLFKNNSNKRFKLSTSQLAKLLNTSVSTISHEIEKTSMRIMRKFMHLRKIIDGDNVEFIMINIIPFAQYKNGVFEFDLNYMVFPYLLEINSHFTEYELKFLLSLSSAYAIKLYKLLIQYKNIKKRIFSLEELKTQFGLIDKYPQYGPFKKYVIDVSVRQINQSTDLKVNYNEIKVGRKVEKLEFIFEIKKNEKLVPKQKVPMIIENLVAANEVDNNIVNELSQNTKLLITKYEIEKGIDYVEASIDYAKKNAKSNLDKYLSDTLIKGWAEVEVKKLQNKKVSILQKIDISKRNKINKDLQKEQANFNKSIIEHEWYKLLDKDKLNYISYSTFILQKQSAKLGIFSSVEDSLPLCVYAVTNQKTYDRALEGYIINVLNISLNINDKLLNI